MDITEYHPFVSPEARDEYLRRYDEKAKKWPVPSETILVDTSFGKTFVRVSGPADGEPLVLLPGLGGNSLFWTAQIKAWSEGHRTYAVDDIYGYGRSVYTRAVESTDDYAGWLNELIGGLGLERPGLVGKSYGGWLAGLYAVRHQDRLSKVVMLAPGATVLPVKPEIYVRMAREFATPRDLLFWMYADFARKDDTSRQALEELIEESTMTGRCFNFKPMLAPTVLEDEELQSLTIPVLVLFGENEKLYSSREALARLKQVSPQIEAEIIPGAGHDLNLVQADLVNERVLEFLREERRHP